MTQEHKKITKDDLKDMAEFLDRHRDDIKKIQEDFLVKGFAVVRFMGADIEYPISKMMECVDMTPEEIKQYKWNLIGGEFTRQDGRVGEGSES